nr:putative reverse transcriptase domain-containing protein [Tanacetum cinerariifolium]
MNGSVIVSMECILKLYYRNSDAINLNRRGGVDYNSFFGFTESRRDDILYPVAAFMKAFIEESKESTQFRAKKGDKSYIRILGRIRVIKRLVDLKEFKKVNEICAKNRVLCISLLYRFLRAQHTSISTELVPFDKVLTALCVKDGWVVEEDGTTYLKIPVHQRNTKFIKNLPSYWGKYVAIVKNKKDISNVSYVDLYTHLKSYEQHAMKTLSKMNQTSGNADPLAYMAKAIQSTSLPSQYVLPPPHGFKKQFPPTNNQLRTSTNLMTQATIQVEAEAFLGDVEYTVSYAKPLAITTTTTFEVSHEDAYKSDVDEGPHAAATFMANLKQTSPFTREGSNNDSAFLEVKTYDNHFFDNMNLQVQNLEQSRVKKDLEQLVFESNKRNADLEEQLVSLKQQLLQHVESNKSLKTECEKLKNDKNALEESYLEELVYLRNTNKVVTELLQSYGQPVQSVPMLSKRLTFPTKDLHKIALGLSNPLYLKTAQLCRPSLYPGDVIVDPVHTPFRVYDSEETLVQVEVSRTKLLERMEDPSCKMSSKPVNDAKLNSLYDTFVPQKPLSREQVYWLPANEVASYNSNQSKPITNFVRTRIKDNLFKEVSKYMKIFDELEKEYDQCVIDKKSLEIKNKNPLIQNECLLAESVSKDICSIVLTFDIPVRMSVEPKNLELEAEILKVKQLLVEKEKRCSFIETEYQKLELKFQKYKACFENLQVCNNSNSPEFNVFFKINKLKDQLQGKDDLIGKLKVQINNMKEVSVGPNLSTLEFQALEIENTQLKKELTAVRIKNDRLRDENVSIKKHYQDLYKSKAESNSNVSSGSAVPEKPIVLAPGLYAMTPKYAPPQKRNNKEVNAPSPRKEKVSLVKQPNVNLPARSENVKRVENPFRNLNKRNRVDSSLSDKRTGFILKSVSVCKTCNECLVFGNHDKCGVKYLNYVNAKNPKKPTGRKFTLGDTCPLTRITKPEVVPLEKSRSVSTSEPAINVTVTPRLAVKFQITTRTSNKGKTISEIALFVAFLINVSIIAVFGTVCSVENLSPDEIDHCSDLNLNLALFFLKGIQLHSLCYCAASFWPEFNNYRNLCRTIYYVGFLRFKDAEMAQELDNKVNRHCTEFNSVNHWRIFWCWKTNYHRIVMSPLTRKKFRWGIVVPTGIKRYKDLKTRLRIKRTNRKCRIPIDLYPCLVKEKLIMRKVEGKWIMKKEMRMISKDGTIFEFLGYTSSKKEEEEEEEEKEEEEEEKEESKKKGSKEALEIGSNSESLGYATFDNEAESDLESTTKSEPKCKEMEDTCESEIERGSTLMHNYGGQHNYTCITIQVDLQIVTHVTNNVKNENANGRNGGNRNGGNNGCSYKAFLACNPQDYDGKGGAVALTRWIEKIKSAIENSGCAENQKVKYATKDICLSNEIEKLESEFWNHTLVGANHAGYTDRFHELAKLVPHLVTPKSKCIERVCYECGSSEHLRNTCLKLNRAPGQEGNHLALEGNQNTQNNGNQARGKAFSENAIDALQDPNIVTGTFSLNDHFATVLFDYGADFSFISTKFAPLLNVKNSTVSPGYVIEVANGKKEEVDRVIRDCKLELGNSLFSIDLIPLGHKSFDVIVRMNLLSKNKAEIVCHEKVVRISLEGREILRVQRECTLGNTKTLMITRADEPKLSDILIVRDFTNVFLKDLSRLPTQRKIKFRINLIPGAKPVAKSPYRLAPLKMQELSEQLQELKNKTFIRPSHSLWGAPVLFVKKKTTKEDHKVYLKLVLELLKKERLYAKFSKCELWLQEVNFLGYVVNHNGIHIDPTQSEAFKEENVPAERLHGLDQQMERKEDESLYFMDHIWVPLVGGVRTITMDESHKTSYSVHPGADKMSHDLRDMYWWRVDRLTKLAHFLVTREDYSIEKFPRLYIDEIIARHGVPVSIISNRDGRFISRFWKILQKALGTRLDMSTAYHLQTDGQSERTIQTLEDMLRAYVIDFGGSWDVHLPLAEFSYNNSYHSSIRRASFEALYGRKYSVHDTFHVSNLKKCLADANLHVPLDEIKVDKTVEEPIEIIDREDVVVTFFEPTKNDPNAQVSMENERNDEGKGQEFTSFPYTDYLSDIPFPE